MRRVNLINCDQVSPQVNYLKVESVRRSIELSYSTAFTDSHSSFLFSFVSLDPILQLHLLVLRLSYLTSFTLSTFSPRQHNITFSSITPRSHIFLISSLPRIDPISTCPLLSSSTTTHLDCHCFISRRSTSYTIRRRNND